MNNPKKEIYLYYARLKKYLTDNKFLILILFILFFVRFQISFLNYLDFKYNKFVTVNAKVVNQYKKKNHYVLKLKTKKLTFYTISRQDLKNLLNENVKLTLITSKISFWEYMFTFYAPSFNIRLLPVSWVEEYIEKQHKNSKTANIFKALFLGDSVDYQTRKELGTLGIAHLTALSGLHLGFISMFLYLLMTPLYKLFQKRFPYRNRFADLAAVIFITEFIYLYITGFPPSLIRAFVLEITVFLYAYNLKNPFSVKLLAAVIVLSLLFFGTKVFSIGYFLSIAGVFYIYLFFKYFKPNILNSFILSFYMFYIMFTVSHMFFANFNLYQLFSPFVNILFALFYPLEIFLHAIGFGGMFDGIILKYMHLGDSFVLFKLPVWFGLMFFLLSFAAFYKRRLFYGINLISLMILTYVIGVCIV